LKYFNLIKKRVQKNQQKRLSELKKVAPQTNSASTLDPKPNDTRYNFKLLICSPSNGNCDELARRMKELKNKEIMNSNKKKTISIVRLGRSETLNKELEEFNFEILTKKRVEDLTRKKQTEKSSSLQEYYKSMQNREIILRKRIKTLKSSTNSNFREVTLFF
jgi:hypothetical protein